MASVGPGTIGLPLRGATQCPIHSTAIPRFPGPCAPALRLNWSSGIGGGPPTVADGLVWTIGAERRAVWPRPATVKIRRQVTIGTPAKHFPTPGIGDLPARRLRTARHRIPHLIYRRRKHRKHSRRLGWQHIISRRGRLPLRRARSACPQMPHRRDRRGLPLRHCGGRLVRPAGPQTAPYAGEQLQNRLPLRLTRGCFAAASAIQGARRSDRSRMTVYQLLWQNNRVTRGRARCRPSQP